MQNHATNCIPPLSRGHLVGVISIPLNVASPLQFYTCKKAQPPPTEKKAEGVHYALLCTDEIKNFACAGMDAHAQYGGDIV